MLIRSGRNTYEGILEVPVTAVTTSIESSILAIFVGRVSSGDKVEEWGIGAAPSEKKRRSGRGRKLQLAYKNVNGNDQGELRRGSRKEMHRLMRGKWRPWRVT